MPTRKRLLLAGLVLLLPRLSMGQDLTTMLSKFLVDLRSGAFGVNQPFTSVTIGATTFAALPGPPTNGTLLYCSDCALATPCVGSGTGAIAQGLNGAWACGSSGGGGGTGDVVGPGSATDGHLALFDGATGKLIKDGGGLGANVATFLATPSSANFASAITDETGSGSAVFATSPTLTAPVSITGVVGSSALTITGATQTVSFPVFDATQTWNNAATTFSGIKLAVTNTASNSGSALIELIVGGTQQFIVRPNGTTLIGNSTGDIRVGQVTFGGGIVAIGVGTGLDIATSSCATAANCRDLRARHIVASGTVPTIDTGCGTGTLATGASDGAGKITTNTTGVCTIVMTFGVAWARAPSCHVNNETTANLSRATTTTTTATFTGTTGPGDIWSYSCDGY